MSYEYYDDPTNYDECPPMPELTQEDLDEMEFANQMWPEEEIPEEAQREIEKSEEKPVTQRNRLGLDLFELITPPDDAQFKKLDFVLPGLCHGDVGVLAGSGGTGKSYVAMELAHSVAYGTKFFDADGSQYYNPDKPRHVKVLNFEDRQANLWNRLIAIRNYARQTHYLAGGWHGWDRMQVLCGHKHAMLLKVMDAMGRINMPVLELFGELCKDTDLLILDPLAQLHKADENNNTLMSNLMSIFGYIAEQTHTAILLVHHASKGAVMSGTANEQQATRGASAIVDASRLTMTLLRVPAGAGGKERRSGAKEGDVELWFPKLNAHAPIPEIALQREQGGVLIQKCEPRKPDEYEPDDWRKYTDEEIRNWPEDKSLPF